MENSRKKELQKTATNIRLGIIEAVYNAASGHPGGSLSIADIMTYLYFEEMNVDPKNPKAEDRDRFVLSKGHTSPALYSTLAERGYFPKEDLKTFTSSALKRKPKALDETALIDLALTQEIEGLYDLDTVQNLLMISKKCGFKHGESLCQALQKTECKKAIKQDSMNIKENC